jgi:hypothetical protein
VALRRPVDHLYKVADILWTAVWQGHIAYQRCRVKGKSTNFRHSSEPGARAGSAPRMVHSLIASIYAILPFHVPRNVRGEARPCSHTTKTYNKHVGCACASMPCMRAVFIDGFSLERFTCSVWSIYRALVRGVKNTSYPKQAAWMFYWLRGRSNMSARVIFW